MHKTIAITINGELYEQSVPIRLLLVDFIRDVAGLTGTHVGCTHEGVCGACTVQPDGHRVTTVEGLAGAGTLHTLQRSFNEHHALQCGFCTAGMLMNAAEFLEENPDPTEAEIRHALVGNLCRCTGYAHIVEAIK